MKPDARDAGNVNTIKGIHRVNETLSGGRSYVHTIDRQDLLAGTAPLLESIIKTKQRCLTYCRNGHVELIEVGAIESGSEVMSEPLLFQRLIKRVNKGNLHASPFSTRPFLPMDELRPMGSPYGRLR